MLRSKKVSSLSLWKAVSAFLSSIEIEGEYYYIPLLFTILTLHFNVKQI